MQQDPLSEGEGDWTYADNDPVDWVDPTGTVSQRVINKTRGALERKGWVWRPSTGKHPNGQLYPPPWAPGMEPWPVPTTHQGDTDMGLIKDGLKRARNTPPEPDPPVVHIDPGAVVTGVQVLTLGAVGVILLRLLGGLAAVAA